MPRYHEFYSELDHMIADLAKEKDLLCGVYPDLYRGEDEPVAWGREEAYRLAGEWRAKLIAELEERPDWVAEWRAEQELDRQIEELCRRKGLRFRPHECPPWDAPDELPADHKSDLTDFWADSLPQAVKLRRKLVAEINARK